MSFKNPLTNMFMAASEGWSQQIAKVDQQLESNLAEDSNATIALADALATELPDPDLIAALRAKRRSLAEGRTELADVRAQYVLKLSEAQQKEFEKANAAELAAQRKAAQVRRSSVAQHVAEIRRCLGPIPEHLAAIHKAVASAEQAVEKAELITGAPFVGTEGIASLLRRAIKAAALEDWFRQPVYETEQSPIEALAVELDARLDAAMDSFDYALGLKPYVAPEPTPEELAAQEDAERRAAAAELHQRRIESGDREYIASHFPPVGVAFVAPGTEEAARARRVAERSDGEAIRRIKSQGM